MEENLLIVPHCLKANSSEQLIEEMLKNNLVNNTRFNYFSIHKDGPQWVAWFNAESEIFPEISIKDMDRAIFSK